MEYKKGKIYLILDIGGVLILSDKTKTDSSDIWASERVNQELFDYLMDNKKLYEYTLLTNNYPGIEALLYERFKLPKFWTHLVNSADIGIAKPDIKIFQYTLKILGTSPRNCIFVDDNESNVLAAESIGMRGIVYKSFAGFKKDFNQMGERI